MQQLMKLLKSLLIMIQSTLGYWNVILRSMPWNTSTLMQHFLQNISVDLMSGLKSKAEFDCLLNEKNKAIFYFTVPLVETVQENVEMITKTNEFTKVEAKR